MSGLIQMHIWQFQQFSLENVLVGWFYPKLLKKKLEVLIEKKNSKKVLVVKTQEKNIKKLHPSLLQYGKSYVVGGSLTHTNVYIAVFILKLHTK